jgi:hypothetical protein
VLVSLSLKLQVTKKVASFIRPSRPNFNRRLAKFIGSAGGWLTAGLNAFKVWAVNYFGKVLFFTFCSQFHNYPGFFN